jgi:uncharacterized phage-like protein YoqJ
VIKVATEAEMRLRRCCFTGHRPEKLQRKETEIRVDLEREIRQAIQDGLTVFITGMAKGIDINAAEIVLQFREEGYPIRLICASPYPGFENSWSRTWQNRYRTVMAKADLMRYICPQYSQECFQIRNEWLVNHSARVIAVFNGQPSGTKNTIDYALRQGIPVVQIKG